jgi:hypothetical protein
MSPSENFAIKLQVAKLIYSWEYSIIDGGVLTFRPYNLSGNFTFTDREVDGFRSVERCAQLITSHRKGPALIAKWVMEGLLGV